MSAVLRPERLVGTWSMTRSITDLATGDLHEMTGLLRITPSSPTTLDWHESGRLRVGDRTFPAWRRYRLLDDQGWSMTFEDGRLFHAWRPDEVVEHACGHDLYRGAYDVRDLPRGWSIDWWVEGPRKRLHLHTDLTVAGSQSHLACAIAQDPDELAPRRGTDAELRPQDGYLAR